MSDAEDLLPHMRRVQGAERDLRDLGVLWQVVESSTAISCPEEAATILPTLMHTRQRFRALQVRLIDRMALETKDALGDALAAKAQCAIDILVRNLYERTADVGFLATDDVVRAFCAAPQGARENGGAAMVRRLAEYQAKYTVYDDIVLLSPAGEVLARLDTAAGVERSGDPIVAEALAAAGYVERFRATDLAPGPAPALLYAHRIAGPDGRPAGVLVLRFRFLDEMQRIFADVADDRHQLALALVGADQRVIVSNDEAHVPPGALLQPVVPGAVGLTAFAGREYVAVCCASRGYQGYVGPGWRAQAMVSLLTAFRQAVEADASREVPLDNPELIAIHAEARAINRDLRRVVWNGRLSVAEQQGDSARLKAVLTQVNTAGLRTRERIDVAIQDLHRTSLARTRRQAGELARLAADIMDRNLYERANDCRWWALSPAVQRALAAAQEPESTPALNAVLDHVNSLYTVYSRLVAFDTQGVVRGASRTAEDGAEALIGTSVDARWLAATQALGDSQRYAVSDFEPTALHAHGPTYTYLAAVRDAGAERRWLGGIAVVFHAARELGAILSEVVAGRNGFAAFVDASGKVLATSYAGQTTEQTCGFDGDAALLEHGGVHLACARARAQGYREFKKGDGYDNQVSAVVGLRLGLAERRCSTFSEVALSAPLVRDRRQTLELAVFQVGAMRYALPSSALNEAAPVGGLVRTPDSGGLVVGLLEVRVGHGAHSAQLVPVACGRRFFGVAYPARDEDGVVLVFRSARESGGAVLGLRVDDVLTVIEVDRTAVHPSPGGVAAYAPWMVGLVDCEAGSDIEGTRRERVLIQVLDPAQMIARGLGLPCEPGPSAHRGEPAFAVG